MSCRRAEVTPDGRNRRLERAAPSLPLGSPTVRRFPFSRLLSPAEGSGLARPQSVRGSLCRGRRGRNAPERAQATADHSDTYSLLRVQAMG
jgi:hypothetical protein